MLFLLRDARRSTVAMPAGRGPLLRAWTSCRIRFARNICSGSPDGPRIRPASSAKIQATEGVPISSWSVQSIAKGNPVKMPVRNDETNQTETVSRFAVRVPFETFEAIRKDKSENGIVQNSRLAEKRRGFIDPEYRMAVLEGRITRW